MEKSAVVNTEVTTGNFHVFSSITLEPGMDSEVSCKIINNLIKTESESRILISDAFYPTSSPWITPFITILVLSSCLTVFVTYKWRQSFKEVLQSQKETNEMKRERDHEKNAIETERMLDQISIYEIQKESERKPVELELRRAQSHAVAVYLESDCKHPDITISEDGRTATLNAKSAVGSLVVVGKEGYVAGKHYWEIKVGKRLDWELGVLSQAERDRTRKGKFSVPLGEERWALKSVRGHLFSSQNEEKIKQMQFGYYSNIGLFLDQESGKIYFYRACMWAPLLITIIDIPSTEKLHPFLSFGEGALDCTQDILEIIHIKIPLPFQKL
ncbi:butyrophilin subfamily 2 member A1-like [Python bivittatus]|uniref:Butyrophilin subfamily 2 member A1-like n=1 Tax=Python bivittatus TaxID=176946 RepID=A0A9F3W1B2_PYTBI|nr:butyrophilin subfamily 2 member A1-like [Python bivittatus]